MGKMDKDEPQRETTLSDIWARPGGPVYRPQFAVLRRIFGRAIYGDVDNRMVTAASIGDTAGVYAWINRGADLRVAGDKALKAAVDGDHRNTAGYLIAYGVSPDKLPEGARHWREYLAESRRAPRPQ
jgi:hypothetical protein